MRKAGANNPHITDVPFASSADKPELLAWDELPPRTRRALNEAKIEMAAVLVLAEMRRVFPIRCTERPDMSHAAILAWLDADMASVIRKRDAEFAAKYRKQIGQWW